MLGSHSESSNSNKASISLLVAFAIAMILGGLMISCGSDDGHAAAGDVFEVDGIEYSVLSDPVSGMPGTAQVGNGIDIACVEGETAVDIPDVVRYNGKRYSVVGIADGAFRMCDQLISVDIPDRVVSIGDYAFEGCATLTSMKIPSEATSIGDHAFDGVPMRPGTVPEAGAVVGHIYRTEYTFSKDLDFCRIVFTCEFDESDTFSVYVDTVINKSLKTSTASYEYGLVNYSKTVKYTGLGDMAVDYTVLATMGFFVAIAGYILFSRREFL